VKIKDALRQYIGEELLDDEAPPGDEENLLADGMVSSLGMLRLVAFIEDSFGLRVPPEDFTIEHFRTIDTLCRYLDGRAERQEAPRGDA